MGSTDLKRFPLGTSFKNWSSTSINKNVKELKLNEVLGYGSKTNVPDTIKETLKKMIENLAIDFSKARDVTQTYSPVLPHFAPSQNISFPIDLLKLLTKANKGV